MRRAFALSLVLMFAGFLLAGEKKDTQVPPEVVKIGNPAPADAQIREIEVSAKKYEFSPAVIEVPVNTLVRIHLGATDREHGFELKAIKDSCVKFKPGSPATMEFYAEKAGEYEFSCCKRCGFGHGKMKGKLVVK